MSTPDEAEFFPAAAIALACAFHNRAASGKSDFFDQDAGLVDWNAEKTALVLTSLGEYTMELVK